MPDRRLFIDILTLARASGHADGIVRTLRELAGYAAESRPTAAFVMHDPMSNTTRSIDPRWLPLIISGAAKVDTSDFPDPTSSRSRFRQNLPWPLRWIAMWIGRPRRKAYLLLERIKLARGTAAGVAARLQSLLLNDKYRRELATRDGDLRTLVPFETAAGENVVFAENDVLVLAGSDWSSMRHQIETAQRDGRPRIVVQCYDVIPLLFPQFYSRTNAQAFRDCFDVVFSHADLVIFNARKIETDAQTYFGARGLAMQRSAIVPLGANFDPVIAASQSGLPDGLRIGRYALFVSTIEPRKGHRVLYNVWKRLLADGIPQANNFKLVFLGRQGWLVDDLVADLKADPCVGDSLILLSNVDDAMLAQLYGHAAFCLYPSLYEGFGLPIIEAFRYGKAVIASDGGALPETVGAFSPIVDASDEKAWYDMLARWISNPAQRQEYERLIRSEFRPRSWSDAAREFFDVIDRKID